ncbi:MAG: pseudouridine-5'-phosphate glycosidase, partial [Candidatus Cloacimonetes bacterium]|nr:pseudouridine-5'-phosphate glycosidase [Candidatus Cloacimonadota bacterium]
IPRQFEIPPDIMKNYINSALEDARQKCMSGKALTPFLLSQIVKLSNGNALKANMRLVENNVLLGCAIATALNSLSAGK